MSSSKPIRMAYLSGTNAMPLSFNNTPVELNTPEFIKWHQKVMAIKDEIATINTTWYPEPRLSNYRKWVLMVEVFEQEWGSDYVPADIKSALEEVKSSI